MKATLAIQRLADGPHSTEAVDAFLRQGPFPLVEGRSITFVWRGGADGVNLKHWIYGLPSSQGLARLADTDLWHLTIDLPEGSRVEYKLEVVRGDSRELVEDPLNPRHARDPYGANSVVQGAGYTVPKWTQESPDTPRGQLDEMTVESATFGKARRILIYRPARFRPTRRYPLLVVHDGGDYLNYAGMKTVLDNLIHRLDVADLVVAFTNADDRLLEYANDARHARFVTDELVPRLESSLPLLGRPEGRCLMGASFGGVAALSTAWKAPGFYGRLLLQSGSFAFLDVGRENPRGPLFDPVVRFMNEFRSQPSAVAERVFVSCGVYESLIYENRSLVPLLQATGMEVRYVEARDGHNWENWRDRLREGLSFLFPGPLLLVYE